MRLLVVTFFFLAAIVTACVDLEDIIVRGTVDVIVVDGIITNLPEPQFVNLSRSKADPVSGRFGTLPIKKATVQVVMDSTEVIPLHETIDGRYQLPGDFKGQVGHAYQLRFTLTDGTRYQSRVEVMPDAVPVSKLYHAFNPTSLPANQPDGQLSRIRAAHDVFIDWQDPAATKNYYRWDWTLWEKQDWCRSCGKGFYLIWDFKDQNILFEDCYKPFDEVKGSTIGPSVAYFVNDYKCRTQCWEVLYSYELNLFDDGLSNGGQLSGRRIAQIPYYQDRGALVEVRQSSLTQSAHQYFKLFQDQTQRSGGVADTPPTALIGNVQNQANAKEPVVGYFSVTSVTKVLHWLDRRDAVGKPPGLFYGLLGLKPSSEDVDVDPNTGNGKPTFGFDGKNGMRPPPPTAVCVPSDSRTPFTPEGWRD